MHEGVETTAIARDGDAIRVRTGAGEHLTGSLVVTAGHGTNDVLARLPGCALQVPISKDRPSEAKYFEPPAADRARFTADAMPVIAYLDTGIYCHPIVDGLVDAVKIGYYNPPDMPTGRHQHRQHRRASSSSACPGCATRRSATSTDVDQCDYDLVADDDFVLGAIPGVANAFVGVGWRGTGYKFAPWVGRVLADLAHGDGTDYDIDRFDPARFQEGGTTTDDAPVTENPAAAPR